MNKAILIGNVTFPPKENEKGVTFGLAAASGKNETVFYSVYLSKDKAEQFKNMLPYIQKGSHLSIIGDLAPPRIYKGRDGEEKVKMTIFPFSINFVGNKKEDAPRQEPQEEEVPF